MADVQAVNYALTYGATPNGKVASNINSGRVRVLYDTYEASSAAAGTDILIGKLTAGARIHDVVIFNDALGASTTLGVSLRDSAGAATVVKAAAASSSAGRQVPVTADIANLPSPEIVGGADVIVKIAGGTATGTIKVQIFYSVA
jgi:hypothetical protein